ncbi:MAG: asparagine synthase [Lachnospiraceae bacterium]|nr:asparagine synthase [Lachnospiraceae bacterium]
MIVDRDYCMSSFLTFRYIVDEEKVMDMRYPHKNYEFVSEDKIIICNTANDIDKAIRTQLEKLDLSNAGILISGGMDSAILASYMPKGMKAYTAKCDAPNAVDETERAKKYCEINGLEHHIVNVTWNDYLENMDALMKQDGCPVFANEPQVYAIVKKMKEDGIDLVIYGDNADMAFGGMDRLLSKDWSYNGWKERYTFVKPERVLKNSVSMDDVYNEYRIDEDKIDFIKFLDIVFASSSSGAYTNAFKYGNIKFYDPYAYMKMGTPYDLSRIRNGESKYLIRELFKIRYPEIEVPEKIAMARSVDYWLRDWEGPKRQEFKQNCIEGMTGEQKFLVYSLERFLNLLD